MKLEKVIDVSALQVYHITDPDKEWKKKFPHKSTAIMYNPDRGIVKLKNSNNAFSWEVMNNLTYIFTTLPPKVIKSMFKDLPIGEKAYVHKKCGLNGGNQSLYSDKSNVVMALYSLPKYEYPPTFTSEKIDIVSNYEEMININPQKFNSAIERIFVEHTRAFNSFVEFVEAIKNKFPLNYMLSIRRFNKVITDADLKKRKPLSSEHFYVGYDMRYGDLVKENKLIQKMESMAYKDNDNIILYETYNNPLETILKQCKNKHIKYTQPHKHCIKLNIKDYLKLELVSRISDFV